MSKENFLILLGVLVLLSPFAGLPMAILVWVLPILGVLIVIVGIMEHRSKKEPETPAES